MEQSGWSRVGGAGCVHSRAQPVGPADGQGHLIIEVRVNDCHPKVDGRFHPFLDTY